MARIVVLGGRGFFGAAAVALLRHLDERPLVAARRPGADLQLDAEDEAALRATLRRGDVLIDAAGPFQERTTRLVEVAIERGCDVVDLADSLDHTQAVLALSPRLAGTTTRLLPACSSVSAVSAALVSDIVQLLGTTAPRRVSAFLVPATRNTSTPATARSLLATLARPVRLLRGGKLVEAPAFGEARRCDFPLPVGTVRGRLGEAPDAITLPLVWPGLRDVDFWVALRRRPLEVLLAAAARSAAVRWLARAALPLGRRLTKRFGARSGGFAVQVEDGSGATAVAGFVHERHSYLVAVAPAVLAARALATGSFVGSGVVCADQQVDPRELRALLTGQGLRYFSTGPGD